MVDPTQLIGPPSDLGYPVPYWFLVLFKVLGFVLHIGPMHLWYAGTILAMLLLFLVLFIAGLVVLVWMIRKAVVAVKMSRSFFKSHISQVAGRNPVNFP